MPGRSAARSRRTSIPVRPGSMRSSTTRSTRSPSARSKPVSPSSADRTSKPCALRPRSMKSTIPGSSSIRTMFATCASYEAFPCKRGQESSHRGINGPLANTDTVVTMSRSPRSLASARRDAGLRRLRIVNRVLIGAAVAVTGLLTDVAAHAFPGHRRPAPARPATAASSTTSRGAAHHARRHRRDHVRHHSRPALRPPAQAPTTASTATSPATTSAAPATSAASAPAPAPQPAPQPAPAPTVSGGS